MGNVEYIEQSLDHPELTRHREQCRGQGFDYYLFKPVPNKPARLAFYSLVHGDEPGVLVPTLRQISERLTGTKTDIPGFLFIPQANPFAAHTETRNDIVSSPGQSLDLNREMRDPPSYPLAEAHQNLIRRIVAEQHSPLGLALMLHEDVEFSGKSTHDGFYFYITGEFKDASTDTKKRIVRFVRTVHPFVELHEGWDDRLPDGKSQTLFNYVRRGIVLTQPGLSLSIYQPHIAWRHKQAGSLVRFDRYQFADKGRVIRSLDGSIEDWMVSHGFAKLALTMEIPAKADAMTKELIVEAIFENFVDGHVDEG